MGQSASQAVPRIPYMPMLHRLRFRRWSLLPRELQLLILEEVLQINPFKGISYCRYKSKLHNEFLPLLLTSKDMAELAKKVWYSNVFLIDFIHHVDYADQHVYTITRYIPQRSMAQNIRRLHLNLSPRVVGVIGDVMLDPGWAVLFRRLTDSGAVDSYAVIRKRSASGSVRSHTTSIQRWQRRFVNVEGLKLTLNFDYEYGRYGPLTDPWCRWNQVKLLEKALTKMECVLSPSKVEVFVRTLHREYETPCDCYERVEKAVGMAIIRKMPSVGGRK